MRTIVLSIILAISYARPQQEEQNSEAVPNYDNEDYSSNYYYENYDTNLGDYETVNSGKICNYLALYHYSVPNLENPLFKGKLARYSESEFSTFKNWT